MKLKSSFDFVLLTGSFLILAEECVQKVKYKKLYINEVPLVIAQMFRISVFTINAISSFIDLGSVWILYSDTVLYIYLA